MRIDFNELKEYTIPGMNGGTGAVSAKMFMDAAGKIMISRLPVGASIGEHCQETSSETNYVLSGSGEHTCDGVIESMTEGICVYCPKGSTHSIKNTGNDDLVLFTVVSERNVATFKVMETHE